MIGARPWWHAALPALLAAWVALAASAVIAYSPLGDAWAWPGAAFDLAVFVVLAGHLGRLEDQHRDSARPPGLDRWGRDRSVDATSGLRLSIPVLALAILAGAFAAAAAVGSRYGPTHGASRLIAVLLLASLVTARWGNPVDRTVAEWWPAMWHRWRTSVLLLLVAALGSLWPGAIIHSTTAHDPIPPLLLLPLTSFTLWKLWPLLSDDPRPSVAT